ncbi:MAG TPA: hypothetical protein VGM69_26940 [Chloroflexota bacterium]|jgi:hypothetical protein
MRAGRSRPPPRLIALLIDLPDGARMALAERWKASQPVRGLADQGTPGSAEGAGGQERRPAGPWPGPLGGATRELYAAMVDPTRLNARLAAIEPACRDVLRGLVAESASLDELLGRVALGRETVERCLGVLGGLCLVVRVESSGRPRPAAAPFGSTRLVVPREIAAALRLAGVTR